ncbi:MAG: DNA phosphorothioation system sulfurtransferase DndC [Marinovum sp.]|nr:DNA phosphorothioation system sulfurtransferase DndC [Marinovum sp.]
MVNLQQLYIDTGDIPWVLGLSGGKDSTALTMYLLETMEQMPPPIRNQKRVYITCVNTLVEAPPVIDHVHKFIERLQLYIEDRGLPVEVVELTPDPEQTFWSNLIGRGYPTPVREFRWCTDRMKIRPATTFIEERSEIFGDPPVVHFLLGTRFDESAARKGTMDAHTRMDSDLHAHGTIPTASTIRPIEDWSTNDVWNYLLKLDWANGMPNPFADINQDLSMLYNDAAGGECPVIHDPSQQTCAGSRFGCWTCTVVSEDKSLNQMIASEKDTYDVVKLAKLAQFRDKLRDERNVTKNRVHGRNRRGVTLVKRDGSVGTGPYTMEYRQKLLTSLTDLQEEVEMELISENEINIIKQIWNEELIHLAKLDAGKAASDGDDA